MEIEKDYEEFLKLLNKHRVKYCIVGAYALAFYAAPRYTKDMDVFIEQTRENAKNVMAALREFGFKSLNLTQEDLMKPETVIQLGYEPVRIDLLTFIDGCSFQKTWQNRKQAKYGSTNVFFIGLKDLIRNKQATNRKQDQSDLELMKQLRRHSKPRRPQRKK